MKQVVKTLCVLFAAAVCLTSDTTSSSTNPVSLTQTSSVNSAGFAATGRMPRSWACQSCLRQAQAPILLMPPCASRRRWTPFVGLSATCPDGWVASRACGSLSPPHRHAISTLFPDRSVGGGYSLSGLATPMGLSCGHSQSVSYTSIASTNFSSPITLTV